ncbi:MAG: lipopolysaccharide heptosyltransferase II [Planctomycetes bacterium]|nr:lipopolysaccharide heptosyltransferase II [Planctomycetota bacterium]
MKRIAVRLPNPIGDVVAATPLLRLLRQRNPMARIIAAGPRPAMELLQGLSTIDEFAELGAETRKGLLGPWREAEVLRRLYADTIYLLPNSFSSALAAALARIPARIGRRTVLRSLLLNESLPAIRKARPMTELYVELDGATEAPPIELAVTERESRLAQETVDALEQHGLRPPFLAVAPGAAFGPSKIYPPEMTAEAVRLCAERTGLQPVLFGSPAESGLIRDIKQRCKAAGCTVPFMHASIGEMKALLSWCRLLLTMDNGSRHVAAALGVPQVVLFGATDPAWTDYCRARTTFLRREEVECSPCHKKVCPIDHRCLRRIEPAVVAEAVVKALRLQEERERLSGPAGAPVEVPAEKKEPGPA